MTTVPDRATFESAYADQAPWDIGRPQKALLGVADRIAGCVLDAGCGTGENALHFAGRGCTVTGIDFLEEPINRAKRKTTERGLPATFLVNDALTLKDWTERFDAMIDSGLFHVFSDEDRRRYVEGLWTILKPCGRLFLLCFSDEEPGTQGPRRVPKDSIRSARSRFFLDLFHFSRQFHHSVKLPDRVKQVKRLSTLLPPGEWLYRIFEPDLSDFCVFGRFVAARLFAASAENGYVCEMANRSTDGIPSSPFFNDSLTP